MYNTILLALALDQGHGQKAMAIARKLRTEGGKIIAVHVLDQIPSFASYYMSPDMEKMSSDKEREIHQEAENSIAERIGKEKDAEAAVLTGHAGRTITDYAEKLAQTVLLLDPTNLILRTFSSARPRRASCVTRNAPSTYYVRTISQGVIFNHHV